MTTPSEPLPDDVATLQAALVAALDAARQAEARAAGAEAMVAHLKLMIAKLKRDRFGPSAERGRRLLDQLELQLEELEATATEDECVAEAAASQAGSLVKSFARKKPVRAPLPSHLPRERVVLPGPSACPCCKMITLDPDTAEANPEILRRVARGHDGKAGVYGAVLVEGMVHQGDEIALLD